MKQKEDSEKFLIEDVNNETPFPGGKVLSVLDGKSLTPPPIWLMRQAGRYLPEYRATRARAGSFLDLCLTPSLATQVTLQPIERFDFDAAILFADILLVPHALGRRVDFIEGEGPVLDPIDAASIAELDPERVLDRLQPIFETVTAVRGRLGPDKTLIGFCGAPWTVATYMVAGRGGDLTASRLMAARQPSVFEALIGCLVEASIAYLAGQIRAGADAVQIFDSWAGVLGPAEFARWCVGPTARIIAGLRNEMPDARVIGFPKGAGLNLEAYAAATGVGGVGLDWTVPLDFAKRMLQPKVAVQGNLDPVVLLAGGDALDRSIDAILAALGHGRFIFNLGHGILPETPIAHVERLVARVRGI